MTDIVIIGAAQTADDSTPSFDVMLTQAENRPEFAPYVVNTRPLDQVWAGDDPMNPSLTLYLRFPNQATAQTILADLWPVTQP